MSDYAKGLFSGIGVIIFVAYFSLNWMIPYISYGAKLSCKFVIPEVVN